MFINKVVVFILLCTLVTNVMGQNLPKEGYILPKIKPQIEVIKHEITPGALSIYYNINFSGMVEIRIFNQNNKIIYQDQYIINKIDKTKPLSIKVNTKNFKPGNYNYALSYKNKKVSSTFSIASN